MMASCMQRYFPTLNEQPKVPGLALTSEMTHLPGTKDHLTNLGESFHLSISHQICFQGKAKYLDQGCAFTTLHLLKVSGTLVSVSSSEAFPYNSLLNKVDTWFSLSCFCMWLKIARSLLEKNITHPCSGTVEKSHHPRCKTQCNPYPQYLDSHRTEWMTLETTKAIELHYNSSI